MFFIEVVTGAKRREWGHGEQLEDTRALLQHYLSHNYYNMHKKQIRKQIRTTTCIYVSPQLTEQKDPGLFGRARADER